MAKRKANTSLTGGDGEDSLTPKKRRNDAPSGRFCLSCVEAECSGNRTLGACPHLEVLNTGSEESRAEAAARARLHETRNGGGSNCEAGGAAVAANSAPSNRALASASPASSVAANCVGIERCKNDDNTVTVTVTKSSSDTLGIVMEKTRDPFPPHVYRTIIMSIADPSLLVDTGLRPGMQIKTINGLPVNDYCVHSLSEILRSFVGDVTIVALRTVDTDAADHAATSNLAAPEVSAASKDPNPKLGPKYLPVSTPPSAPTTSADKTALPSKRARVPNHKYAMASTLPSSSSSAAKKTRAIIRSKKNDNGDDEMDQTKRSQTKHPPEQLKSPINTDGVLDPHHSAAKSVVTTAASAVLKPTAISKRNALTEPTCGGGSNASLAPKDIGKMTRNQIMVGSASGGEVNDSSSSAAKRTLTINRSENNDNGDDEMHPPEPLKSPINTDGVLDPPYSAAINRSENNDNGDDEMHPPEQLKSPINTDGVLDPPYSAAINRSENNDNGDDEMHPPEPLKSPINTDGVLDPPYSAAINRSENNNDDDDEMHKSPINTERVLDLPYSAAKSVVTMVASAIRKTSTTLISAFQITGNFAVPNDNDIGSTTPAPFTLPCHGRGVVSEARAEKHEPNSPLRRPSPPGLHGTWEGDKKRMIPKQQKGEPLPSARVLSTLLRTSRIFSTAAGGSQRCREGQLNAVNACMDGNDGNNLERVPIDPPMSHSPSSISCATLQQFHHVRTCTPSESKVPEPLAAVATTASESKSSVISEEIQAVMPNSASVIAPSRWKTTCLSFAKVILVLQAGMGVLYLLSITLPYRRILLSGNIHIIDAVFDRSSCFVNNPTALDDVFSDNNQTIYQCDGERKPCPQWGRCQEGKLLNCDIGGGIFDGHHRLVPSVKGDRCVPSPEANEYASILSEVLMRMTSDLVCQSGWNDDDTTFPLFSMDSVAEKMREVSDEENPTLVMSSELLRWLSPVFDSNLVRFGSLSGENGSENWDAIGLGQDVPPNSLPLPMRCRLNLMLWELLGYLFQSSCGLAWFLVNKLFHFTTSYPIRSIGALLFGKMVQYLKRRRTHRAKVRELHGIVIEAVYDRLSECEDHEGYAALILRDDIGHYMFPNSPPQRFFLNDHVWPRVALEIKADNRVRKFQKSVHGKKLVHWEFAVQSKRGRRLRRSNGTPINTSDSSNGKSEGDPSKRDLVNTCPVGTNSSSTSGSAISEMVAPPNQTRVHGFSTHSES
jgi:hypothetical protein